MLSLGKRRERKGKSKPASELRTGRTVSVLNPTFQQDVRQSPKTKNQAVLSYRPILSLAEKQENTVVQ